MLELVQTRTADGVRLDGALALPKHPGDDAAKLPVDAVLALHGTGSNFYGGGLFEGLTPKLLADGLAVLRVNTRGHDAVSIAATLQGPKRLGGAFECVDDCKHDVIAWAEFLATRGYRAIAVVGHSLGAVKALYTAAHTPHPAIQRLLAVSPPHLSYARFSTSDQAATFLQEYEQAKQLAAAGQGDTLLNVKIPLPFLFSATSYLDKYGPDEKYNFLKWLDKLSLPTLFVFGGLEVERELAFRDLPETVTNAIAPTQNIRVVTIAGANHVYTGQIDELAYKLRAWLAAEQQFVHA